MLRISRVSNVTASILLLVLAK